MKNPFKLLSNWYAKRRRYNPEAAGLRQHARTAYLIILACVSCYLAYQNVNTQLGIGALIAGTLATITLLIMASRNSARGGPHYPSRRFP